MARPVLGIVVGGTLASLLPGGIAERATATWRKPVLITVCVLVVVLVSALTALAWRRHEPPR